MKKEKLKRILIIVLIAIIIILTNQAGVKATDNGNEAIPDYFNLADSYNLKVENQGSEGNCWTFASLNSIETYLMMHGYGEYDFSERHLSYIESKEFYGTKGYSVDREPNTSGNFEQSMDYVTSGYGPVLEEDFPYNKNYTINDYEEMLNVTPEAYVGSYISFPSIIKDEDNKTDSETVEKIRNNVKRHIMENGAVAALVISMQCSDEIYNEATAAEYIPPEVADYIDTGVYRHIVSIIGWDDNYSKENFNEVNQPENDGAYIVLNSWGKEFGKDGIFYVSYEDAFVEQDMYGITEAATNKNDLESLKIIKFNDVNLYNKIKEILGKKITIHNDSERKIILPEASINGVERLDLSKSEISDLSGIEGFTKLRYLDLSNNEIDECSVLSQIEYLDELNLSNNKITDISGIFPQEKDENKSFSLMNLSGNNLSSLNALANVDLIRELNLSNTGLTDAKLAELDGAKIKTLDISKNTELTDVSSLASLVVDDGESLEKKSLSKLDLSFNKNIDLSTIPSGLEALYLSNMELQNDDLTKINYDELTELGIAYNTDITSLESIPDKSKIRILDLSGDKNINISNLSEEFIWLDKLVYQNCDLDSIIPLLGYREMENEYIGTIRRGIPNIDASYNNIDLAENDFAQLQEIINSPWISFVDLSHNKTTDIANFDTAGHYFTMDLSYNNIYPSFYSPDFVFKMDNQDYTEDLYVDTSRANDFKEIGQNFARIYNTRYAVGNADLLEFEGVDFDAENNSFIITSNPGEQSIIRINGGKYDGSTVTYNIKSKDDIVLERLYVAQGAERRVYVEGEDFDTTGLAIYGVYSNNSYTKLDGFDVIGGENLQHDQGIITISKEGKEIEFEVMDEMTDYYDPNNYWYILVYKEDDVTSLSFDNKPLYDVLKDFLKNIIKTDDESQTIVIPKTVLENVYQLNIASDELESLDGLENILPNLSSVDLKGKKIKDISAIKDYDIFSIEINDNDALESLDVLKDNENLAIVTLKNTKIKDINKLTNVTELTVNSNVIPDFKDISNNLKAVFITEKTELSKLEYENNKYKLPDYLQDVLNGHLPNPIDINKKEIKAKAEIKYLIRDDKYANSSKTEEIELTQDSGVWQVDLTNFINNNDIKNRQLIIPIDVMGEWGRIANYSYVIDYDKTNEENSESGENGSGGNDASNVDDGESDNAGNENDGNGGSNEGGSRDGDKDVDRGDSNGGNNENRDSNNASKEERSGKSDASRNSGNNNSNNSVKSPRTGDDIRIYFVLGIISAIGLVIVIGRKM